MILSDKTIESLIRSDQIKIRPPIVDEQIQPASLDVRLGRELINKQTMEICDYHRPGVDKQYLTVLPGVFYLGTTLDRVELPNDIAAQLVGRSSIGRKGVVVHKTAGWIDPGFRGQITLEIYNFSDEPVELAIGSRVGQLVFFPLDQASRGYDGQYQDQAGVQQ